MDQLIFGRTKVHTNICEDDNHTGTMTKEEDGKLIDSTCCLYFRAKLFVMTTDIERNVRKLCKEGYTLKHALDTAIEKARKCYE